MKIYIKIVIWPITGSIFVHRSSINGRKVFFDSKNCILMIFFAFHVTNSKNAYQAVIINDRDDVNDDGNGTRQHVT
jgi:hypothetical protein